MQHQGKAERRIRIPKNARIGRFHVMALLQAARYYLLYGDMDKAKSFGLNRAIFYAWAKYYGPSTGHYHLKRRDAVPQKVREVMERVRRGESSGLEAFMGEGAGRRREPLVVVDDRGKRWAILFDGMEAVPVGRNGWFEMGGKEQRPEDFDKQVAKSFEAVGIPFDVAWRAALEYVRRFPVEVLKSPSRFYKYVYEPVRDSFIDSVVRTFIEAEQQGEQLHSAISETRQQDTSEDVKRGAKSGSRGAGPPFRTLDEFLGKRQTRNDK
ncbi:hypothetical protein Pyrfu_1625 [Pyrolobus fumarii 1A]|uniref:Uncharacterized protein n=1 Tax=Pyrolobus fumarii (strain DSM 11204 / 1A) TaxID=694429 RepID=G0ECB2_PYRF1|nr:hypothetical protein [Pyrolobus fumarii]AEM39482.1 hypothetical protein Pyrfu_1625 [Pyrolobus fumarii 1A]